MNTIYKIVDRTTWRAAVAEGVFRGAPVDLKDGYIHFSTAQTVRETARRHFAGQDDLLLAAFDADAFADALIWEPSRGGALFPHLYAPLDPALALSVIDLPRDASGDHVFPEGVP